MPAVSEPYIGQLDRWLADLGSQKIRSVEPRLFGATTATIIPFVTDDQTAMVAKIYDRAIEGVGTDDVVRDAAAMRAASEVRLNTPVLIDADPAGERVGHPALLMTRLNGSPRAFGADEPERWVDGLADALIDIAAAPLPTSPLPSYRSWVPTEISTPTWSSRPALWDAVRSAIAVDHPTSPPRLIHRDFHQLNVLWSGSSPSGTVDWVNGCLGPIESDISACRVNIALADQRYDGVALADRFLRRCQDAELPWHPSWDLDFIAGAANDPHVFLVGRDFGADMTVESVSAAFETMATRALDALPRSR